MYEVNCGAKFRKVPPLAPPAVEHTDCHIEMEKTRMTSYIKCMACVSR
jgi:hypothetical protein